MKTVTSADIARCPIESLEASHYNDDGTCTCRCLNQGPDCQGKVEYRMPLSGTGRSFLRCDHHWDERLEVQRGIDERYPTHPPADWSPMDAGESWYEED